MSLTANSLRASLGRHRLQTKTLSRSSLNKLQPMAQRLPMRRCLFPHGLHDLGELLPHLVELA
eukprot:2023722-Alexandrium_andersonii.AAC.1